MKRGKKTTRTKGDAEMKFTPSEVEYARLARIGEYTNRTVEQVAADALAGGPKKTVELTLENWAWDWLEKIAKADGVSIDTAIVRLISADVRRVKGGSREK